MHTGDLAQVDANGCVYIVDRLKELIKYKGYQVPPAELEAVLLSHPEIADAAVIGVVDAEGEEVPKAFVVKQSEAELERGRGDGLRRRSGRAVQEGPPGGVHRGDPEVGVRQDPAQGFTNVRNLLPLSGMRGARLPVSESGAGGRDQEEPRDPPQRIRPVGRRATPSCCVRTGAAGSRSPPTTTAVPEPGVEAQAAAQRAPVGSTGACNRGSDPPRRMLWRTPVA